MDNHYIGVVAALGGASLSSLSAADGTSEIRRVIDRTFEIRVGLRREFVFCSFTSSSPVSALQMCVYAC